MEKVLLSVGLFLYNIFWGLPASDSLLECFA